MLIFKELTFDAAHYLTSVPEGHKCRNMHGHTYRLKIWLDGPLNDNGWVMDFTELKKALLPVTEQLDHNVLNTVPGLENPTCELVAVWIWNQLKPGLPMLKKVELYETPGSGVIYEGD
ncbi:MAG TPA: 6-carboxytetrahydropterin synthase QueD [Chitinophagaceae bacterium]